MVASGTGFRNFGSVAGPIPAAYPTFGMLRVVVVTVPVSTNPTFEWVISDASGKAIAGSTGTLTGDTALVEDTPLTGGGKFMILNASLDGTYSVMLVVNPSGLLTYPPPYV